MKLRGAIMLFVRKKLRHLSSNSHNSSLTHHWRTLPRNHLVPSAHIAKSVNFHLCQDLPHHPLFSSHFVLSVVRTYATLTLCCTAAKRYASPRSCTHPFFKEHALPESAPRALSDGAIVRKEHNSTYETASAAYLISHAFKAAS